MKDLIRELIAALESEHDDPAHEVCEQNHAFCLRQQALIDRAKKELEQ